MYNNENDEQKSMTFDNLECIRTMCLYESSESALFKLCSWNQLIHIICIEKGWRGESRIIFQHKYKQLDLNFETSKFGTYTLSI